MSLSVENDCFIRLSFAQQDNGLDVSALWLIPAFIVPCAGAYRLARYNISTTQSTNFQGVPIPAVGILFASFPLIYWFSDQRWAIELLLNKWIWYVLIIVTAYLMISTLPMMSLKFKDMTIKNNLPKIILLVVAIVAAVLLQWVAVPIVFIIYVILSVVMLPKETPSENIRTVD